MEEKNEDSNSEFNSNNNFQKMISVEKKLV